MDKSHIEMMIIGGWAFAFAILIAGCTAYVWNPNSLDAALGRCGDLIYSHDKQLSEERRIFLQAHNNMVYECRGRVMQVMGVGK